MGDLVAVMEVGGNLAQFGTPDEILANPASDFVARFVGADRGLKRLALSRVEALELRSAVTARVGDDSADARRRIVADPLEFLLLVDAANRPVGWIGQRQVPANGVLTEAMASAMSPLLDGKTTLKDALAMLIDAEVQVGIVVDGRGAVQGLVTADEITAYGRRDPGGAEATAR